MHTKEPWEVKSVHGEVFIAAKPYKGHPYFERTTTIEIMSDEDYPTKDDDARRIVACVNACAGIPTEFLEAGNSVSDAVRHFQTQRDELLAALTHAVEIAEAKRAGTWDDVMEYRKVIAKADLHNEVS